MTAYKAGRRLLSAQWEACGSCHWFQPGCGQASAKGPQQTCRRHLEQSAFGAKLGQVCPWAAWSSRSFPGRALLHQHPVSPDSRLPVTAAPNGGNSPRQRQFVISPPPSQLHSPDAELQVCSLFITSSQPVSNTVCLLCKHICWFDIGRFGLHHRSRPGHHLASMTCLLSLAASRDRGAEGMPQLSVPKPLAHAVFWFCTAPR